MLDFDWRRLSYRPPTTLIAADTYAIKQILLGRQPGWKDNKTKLQNFLDTLYACSENTVPPFVNVQRMRRKPNIPADR